ncbi:MAG: lysoplasmalogenase [Cytophagales bacterium]|jgi:uncharacterized membrane protein YhhN|nr:lysoplasmalogenase [Cytophagales bacterium]MCA6386851.1 lysoplasmalogenase [Cytophagales bacterium]MCA6390848.1 lysoplasmalogenase [Cytophagales bacterium]MCA6395963.1 lysoplasmalogenase [Cytophagales bacterium]MCA6397536.1 lysoplasmalogenase [Cytophagales bacterium]
MQVRRDLPVLIFAVGVSAELGTAIFDYPGHSLIFKPLIMIGLMAYYYALSPARSRLFLVALFFCWLGDVFLIFQSTDPLFFIGGLASFLAGHIVYIFCYRQLQIITSSKELLGSQKVRFAFPIILAGTGLVTILYPLLGELRIPVMIYALVITLMALTALFRYGRTNSKSFFLIFIGAVLFMVSDSLLAINKFHHAFSAAGALVMLTYSVAQFLIVEGALAHEKKGD